MLRSQGRHRPKDGRGHVRRGRGTIAAAVGGCLVLVNVRWPEGPVGDVTYLTVAIGASIVAWRSARHSGNPVSLLIALGVTLSAMGDVVVRSYIWAGVAVPDASAADVGWLGAYVAVIAALLRLLKSHAGLNRDAWIDVVAVTFVSLLIQWEVAVSPLVSANDTPLSVRMVWALYPALDSVLIALVVRASMARVLDVGTAVLAAGGAACWFGADLAYTLLAPTGGFSSWQNAGWLLGAMLLAGGAWRIGPLSSTARRPTVEEHFRVGGVRIALGLAPLLIPGAIEVVEWRRGHDPNPVGLYAATAILVGLAFLRARSLAREGERARRALGARERVASAVAANGSDAAILLDEHGTVREEAPELANLLGLGPIGTVGLDIFGLVSPDDLAEARAAFDRTLASPGHTHEGELRVYRTEGHPIWLGVRATNMLDDPDVRSVIISVHDITARKSIEVELAHQAFHDTLTGLPNRALFSDRTQQALGRCARTGEAVAVVFLDLDEFKTVNDSLGHAAGDELLREVAGRLATAVRPGDTVARFGGDEFSVLIDESRRPADDAAAVAARILAVLSVPITVADQQLVVSASIGIAVAEPGDTASSLLRDADVAMYRAKREGRGRWVLHDQEMRAAAFERLQLETDLVCALDKRQLRLVYQPVIHLSTDTLVGFEALLRWEHPSLGTVSPDRFIPIAEDNGTIVRIGGWVLSEACRTLAQWDAASPRPSMLSMSVNVSARQIASTALLPDVEEALAESGLDPSRLVLEITETSLVQDPVMAAEKLAQLRALGVRLAIDDFGTGYSSLSYLRQFPVDVLKIDRSFVSSIRDAATVPPIVRGLLDLGKTLELTVVAEGVEDEVQRAVLRGARCDHAQGFLFARPLTALDAAAMIRSTQSPAPEHDPRRDLTDLRI